MKRKASLASMVLEQTEAQWASDNTIYDVNVQLVPTDGTNQGKHKLADGLKTYNQLSFVDVGVGGGLVTTTDVQNISNWQGATATDALNAAKIAVDAAGNIIPFVYVISGSVIATYRLVGSINSKPWYRNIDSVGPPDPDIPFDSVLWADSGSGLKWNVSDPSGEVMYYSPSNVATPDLATGWVAESGFDLPTPSILLVSGPTVQEALEQLAGSAASAGVNEEGTEGWILRSGVFYSFPVSTN